VTGLNILIATNFPTCHKEQFMNEIKIIIGVEDFLTSTETMKVRVYRHILQIFNHLELLFIHVKCESMSYMLFLRS